jgi:hypothetical protein
VEATHNEREVIERVEAVHGWANAQLLDLIVHKSGLISHLRFAYGLKLLPWPPARLLQKFA